MRFDLLLEEPGPSQDGHDRLPEPGLDLVRAQRGHPAPLLPREAIVPDAAVRALPVRTIAGELPAALRAAQEPAEQVWERGGPAGEVVRVAPELVPGGLEDLRHHECRDGHRDPVRLRAEAPAGCPIASVEPGAARVEFAGKKPSHRGPRPEPAARGMDLQLPELRHDPANRPPLLDEPAEDHPDHVRLLLVDGEAPWPSGVSPVAVWNRAGWDEPAPSLLSLPAQGPLADLGALVLGHDALDLKQEAAFRRPLVRRREEHEPHARPLELLG